MSEQKTVAFHTLGCKVNQYDTQAMRERFEQAGYRTTEFDGQADIYVVNTCTVTGTGDKKSMQIIRRCHRQNPQAQIVVVATEAPPAARAAWPAIESTVPTRPVDRLPPTTAPPSV